MFVYVTLCNITSLLWNKHFIAFGLSVGGTHFLMPPVTFEPCMLGSYKVCATSYSVNSQAIILLIRSVVHVFVYMTMCNIISLLRNKA